MGFKWLGSTFCFHRKLRWGVNPSNNNTEPQCRKCGKFISKQTSMRVARFGD